MEPTPILNASAYPSGVPSWLAHDLRHVWHPYTQALTAPEPIPVARAEGVWLYTPAGARILDAISSWWCCIHGHNHPALNEALTNQAASLAQVIYAGFCNEPAARLAAALVAHAPKGLTRVFYTDDGSTAVEVAMKMALQYWAQAGSTERVRFASMAHAYHGETFGAMGLGGGGDFHRPFQRLVAPRLELPAPHACCNPEVSTARIAGHCLARIDALLAAHAHELAGVVVEPVIQAAGGMLIWPDGFLRRLAAIVHKHGLLLIADEVFTGFGRAGAMFACLLEDVRPDILCLSKALTAGYLPLGATLTSEELYSAFLHQRRERAFLHGHTFSGNALSCAVALASLSLFDDGAVIDSVRRISTHMQLRLERLRGHPRVSDVRCKGAVAAVELLTDGDHGYLNAMGPQLNQAFVRRGILLRPLGNVIYVTPPYVITNSELDAVFDAIESEVDLL